MAALLKEQGCIMIAFKKIPYWHFQNNKYTKAELSIKCCLNVAQHVTNALLKCYY